MAVNPLIGLPLVLVLLALLWPLLGLNGARPYLELLTRRADIVLGAAVAWIALTYWLARRVSDAILLRVAGDKVLVRRER
jgi:hypothetical protein